MPRKKKKKKKLGIFLARTGFNTNWVFGVTDPTPTRLRTPRWAGARNRWDENVHNTPTAGSKLVLPRTVDWRRN